MKKILLITLVAFLAGFANSLMAQNFRGRVILGINGAQVDGDQRSGWYKPGLVAGFGAEFPFNEKISLEPCFLYSAKGSTTSPKELDAGALPQQINLNYFEMPLLFNYYIRPELRAQFGLIPQYLLSASCDAGTGAGEYNSINQFKKVDIMSSLGLEYILSERWGANVRFNYSILPFNAGDLNFTGVNGIGAPQYSGLKNNVLCFTLSYILVGGVEQTNSGE